MAQKVQGTEDLFGGYMRAWQLMQDVARELFGSYGFDMIETPAIEQVDTFVHGIGESTDVVRKEMFRVFSGALLPDVLERGSESHLKPRQRMAMRPEGTAGVVRAAVENNFVPQGAAPAKLWYAEAMFRGERPQKGRLRQFHQVGVEWLGASDPAADAECIIMLMQYFERLGFARENLRLVINSMGDAACRPAYREKVRAFILDHADEMCEDCLERAEINPLRAFDCKNDHCREVMKDAPLAPDNLCEECAAHYAAVKRYLDAAGVSYVEDPTLVRGLDYYTRTVFEVEAVGSGVGAIGGGGRYDGLMELEGGKPTPGVGFAVGFERAMLALEKCGIGELAKLSPHALSAGQRQLVLLARAVVNRPVVILADEPVAHLDQDNARTLLELLGAFVRAGVTVVAASHERIASERVPIREVLLTAKQLEERAS